VCPPPLARSSRTASVLGALDTKLAEIEATEKQKRGYLVAYDLSRQATVSELLIAQQHAIAAQAQAKLTGVMSIPPPAPVAAGTTFASGSGAATAAGSRRGVLSNMGGVGSSSDGLQIQSVGGQLHVQMQQTPSPTGDEMDLDPPQTPSKDAASRKKPPTSSPTTSGPAVRKRARNGQ
jgi:hypothetical protein